MAEITLFDRGSPVTQGLLAKFLRCRKEARLFLRGISPRKLSRPLVYGDLAHRVLENVYCRARSNPVRWCPEKISANHKMIEEIVTRESKTVHEELKQKLNPASSVALAEDTASLRAILPEYFRHWAEDDFGPHAKWAQPEQKFDLILAGSHVAGKIDGAVRLGKSRSLWLFESKTYSQVNEKSLLTLLWRDLQVNFYALALKQLAGEWPSGVLYNVLRKPSIKRKSTETLREWEERLRADVRKRPAWYFHRFEVPLSREAMLRFRKELTETLSEFWVWYRAGMPVHSFGMPCETKWGLCSMAGWCHNGAKYEYEQRKVLYPELEN